MTRKSWTFFLSVLAMSSSLVAFTWAQAAPDRFSRYLGIAYTVPDAPPSPEPLTASRLAQLTTPQASVVDRVHHWNLIAINSSGLDHTPVPPGDPRVFGEQLGPGRSARAIAIVQIAVFDAVNSIAKRYRGFTRIPDAPNDASMDAAIAQAAHDTLVVMFPSQKAHCDELLAEELAGIRDGRSKTEGIRTGQRAAQAILAQTANDGSNHAEPSSRRGLHPEQSPRQVAPGSDQPDPARARRALG